MRFMFICLLLISCACASGQNDHSDRTLLTNSKAESMVRQGVTTMFYSTHVRDDADNWEKSIREAIEISGKSGARLQISHNESHYPNWGKEADILAIIEEARARGLEVTTDVPPYTSGSLWADIVAFDPEGIEDQATYSNPHQYPKGIPYVIVNGKVVIENGEHTGALPGEILRNRT